MLKPTPENKQAKPSNTTLGWYLYFCLYRLFLQYLPSEYSSDQLHAVDYDLTVSPISTKNSHEFSKKEICDSILSKLGESTFEEYKNNAKKWFHNHKSFIITMNNVFSVQNGMSVLGIDKEIPIISVIEMQWWQTVLRRTVLLSLFFSTRLIDLKYVLLVTWVLLMLLGGSEPEKPQVLKFMMWHYGVETSIFWDDSPSEIKRMREQCTQVTSVKIPRPNKKDANDHTKPGMFSYDTFELYTEELKRNWKDN